MKYPDDFINKVICGDCLEVMKDKPKDKTFHYTNPEMVRDLIRLVPISEQDTILDAGSGKNKVWFNELRSKKFEFAKITDKECTHGNYVGWCDDCEDKNKIYECEIDDGCDFFEWDKKVDWVIGNPPFHLGWAFLDKASEIAEKGIAFLGNLNFWNSCLPNRFEKLKEKGFYLNKIHILQDKRWFGRYYFLVFEKKENNFVSWNTNTYE